MVILILGSMILFHRIVSSPLQKQTQEEVITKFLFSGVQFVIDDQYQTCHDNRECIAVETHCGFCCQSAALNIVYETLYDNAFEDQCRLYQGATCKCFDLSSYPSCVEGHCQLIKWPEEK